MHIITKTLMTAAATMLAATMTGAAAVPGPVGGRSLTWTDSTSIEVRLELSAGDASIKGNRRLIVTPRIVGQDGNQVALPQVEFAGRQNRKYNDRRALLAGETRTGVYAKDDTVAYVQTVAVEPWMLSTPLRLELSRDIEGCCNVEQLPGEVRGTTIYVAPYVPALDMVVPRLSVAEEMAKHEPVLHPVSDYKPYDSSIPLRKMTGALYVHFPVNKWDIREDFRDNGETLDRIVRLLRAIEADTASAVKKIVILGLASPEGPLDFNQKLSERRAASLRDYVDERVDMSGVDYELVGAGEAWADLRDMILDSDLDEREEVIAILDAEPDLNRREALLRRLNGGRVFDYLNKEVFIDQRNSGYIQVYFDAQPDIPAQTINRASELVRSGKAQQAIALLASLDDDRKWNVLGSAYYVAGQRDKALDCWRKAAGRGDEDAARNIKEVEHRMELERQQR